MAWAAQAVSVGKAAGAATERHAAVKEPTEAMAGRVDRAALVALEALEEMEWTSPRTSALSFR